MRSFDPALSPATSAVVFPLTDPVTLPPRSDTAAVPEHSRLVVHGSNRVAEAITATLSAAKIDFERDSDSDCCGIEVDDARLCLTDGRCADAQGGELALFDLPLADVRGAALAWTPAAQASADWVDAVPRWLALLGFEPRRMEDAPGLIVARTLAMLINEAADAVQQGVCDTEAADTAMKLGVNYPAGPFEWLRQWPATDVVDLLERLDDHYRGERYRVSPWLKRAAWNRRQASRRSG